MSKTVALDIGHGVDTFPPGKGIYKDGKGYPEHSFNEKLVTEIDKLLRSHGVDTIIYQKPNTKDIPLMQRTNYYNKKKVNLVYSIHANANGDPNVNGRCAFYWHTANDAKNLAQSVAANMIDAGYSTHGNGTHASKRGSWTNLHICRETNMTAVLVENGFMTGNKDFELVFGNKQAEYINDMAHVHTKSICEYFGIKYDGKASAPSKPKPSKKPSKPKPKPSKKPSGSLGLVDYMETKKMDSSYNNRKKLASKYGISKYTGTASQNTTLLSKIKNASKPTSKPKAPSMATAYIGKRLESKTNGLRFYAKRSWDDKDVVGSVNKGYGFPTIVSRHKVGSGYQYAVKNSKGATYYITASSKFVSVAGASKSKAPAKKKTSFKVGSRVTVSKSARFYSTGERIPNHIKGNTYTIMQVGKGKVLLREIMSWVQVKDIS